MRSEPSELPPEPSTSQLAGSLNSTSSSNSSSTNPVVSQCPESASHERASSNRECSTSSGNSSPGSSSSTSSQQQPVACSTQESKLEYLEQKYGSSTSHVHLSRDEVDAMVDKVLTDSPTVTYLLQSLKQVCECVCIAHRAKTQSVFGVLKPAECSW